MCIHVTMKHPCTCTNMISDIYTIDLQIYGVASEIHLFWAENVSNQDY